jgi:hypothetical protein
VGIGAVRENTKFYDDGDYFGGAHWFQGQLDEVRIWNNARTASQIQNNLGDIIAKTEEGLVAYWRFEEGSGNLALDETDNNVDAPVEGAIWKQPGSPFKINQFIINDEGECTAEEITFQWSSLNNADSYQLEVATEPNEASIIDRVDVGDVTVYNYNATQLEEGRTYYGRIGARFDGGASYDSLSNFTDGILVDHTAPAPNKPAGRVKGDSSVVFTFSGSDNIEIVQFNIQIDDDVNFSEPLADTELLPGESYEFKGTPGNTYYARAKAFDCAGNQSAYSDLSDAVKITPLPDLDVSDIQAPLTAIADNEIEVEWEVTNVGDGATRSNGWDDVVYFEREREDGTMERLRLGSVGNASFLGVGQEYKQQASFTIPLRRTDDRTGEVIVTEGEYDVVVKIDPKAKESESSETNNSAKAGEKIDVELPPLPDLKVSSINEPVLYCLQVVDLPGHGGSGSSGLAWLPCGGPDYIGQVRNMEISISSTPPFALGTKWRFYWEVTNVGNAPAEEGWAGTIYYQIGDSTFNPDKATRLGTTEHWGTLDVEETDTVFADMQTPDPDKITDQGHFYIITNSDAGVFEGVSTDNNLFRDETTTEWGPTQPSDLEPQTIEAPQTALSGDSVDIVWTVKNNGPSAVQPGAWMNRIYISEDNTLNTEKDSILSIIWQESDQQKPIQPDSIHRRKIRTKLPDGIEGTYYLFAKIDASDRVNEFIPNQGDFEDNNMVQSDGFQVELADYPDLTVSTINASSTAKAGTNLLVEYTAHNNQTASHEIDSTWIDRIYISGKQSFGKEAISLDPVEVEKPFKGKNSYSQAENVSLPRNLQDSTYYLHVFVDASRDVYEHGADDQNNIKSIPIDINPEPRPDLKITEFNIARQPVAGQPLGLSWRVENRGNAETEATSWRDNIFLSKDTLVNRKNDIHLGQSVHKGRLGTGDSYNSSLNVGIPGNAVGDYYVLLATDFGEGAVVREINSSNNITSNGVNVAAGPLPDLRVESIEILDTPTAAQPLELVVEVVNAGEALPARSKWWDAWTFSEEPKQTESSERLHSETRNGPLGADASYTDTVTLEIPRYAKGSYYILTHTDSEGFLGESDREANNKQATPISVEVPPPSDLVARNIQIPQNARPGEKVVIQYDLVNIGDNPARGFLDDAIYISADQDLETSDPRIGLRDQDLIDLHPSESMTVKFTVQMPDLSEDSLKSNKDVNFSSQKVNESKNFEGPVPGVLPGNYHVIIWADVRNNINESNDANNTTVSADQTSISVPALTPGTPEQVAFSGNNRNHYYKVDVDKGKDLRLSLNNIENEIREETFEMYIAYDRAPTPGDFDVAFQAESDQNPRILLPETQNGTYYIMVRNLYLSDSTAADLLAESFSFTLFDVTPDEGGSSGRLVTTITGAQLDSANTEYYLTNGNRQIEGEIVNITSTMKAEVRFDLRDHPIDNFDLVAEKDDGSETRLEDGFEIVTPIENQLKASITMSDRLRIPRHRPVSFPLTVKNENNIDHDIVVVTVLVPGDQKFMVQSDDLKSAYLLPEDSEIPQDSLPNAGIPVRMEREDGLSKTMGVITLIAKDVRVGETLTAQLRSPDIDNRPVGSSLMFGVRVKSYSRQELAGLIRQKAHDVARGMRKSIRNTSSRLMGGDSKKNQYISKLEEVLAMSKAEIVNAYQRTGVLGDGSLTEHSGRPLYDPQDIIERQQTQNTEFNVAKAVSTSTPFSDGNNNESNGCGDFGTAANLFFTAGTVVATAAAIGVFGIETVGVIGVIAIVEGAVFGAIALDSAISGRDYGLTGDIGAIPTSLDIVSETVTHAASFEFICSTIFGAFDPNDIVGPAGEGAANWVKRDQTLPYKIRFENDPERANAPAQTVVVNQPLDSALDMRTFRIQGFGFGGRNFEVTGSKGQVQRRIDVRDSLDVFVDFNAGLDASKGGIYFSFRSIDPGTDRLPSDPTEGFLPPNDSTGVGEGFVEYTIEPLDTVSTGTEIEAQADIVFDQNAAIETPEVFNTIDADAPVSNIPENKASFLESGDIQLNWHGNDSMPGSGTQQYTIYAASGDESFEPVAMGLTDTSYVFDADTNANKEFRFFTIAEDAVGNTENIKEKADATVKVATDESPVSNIPEQFELGQNYPNPFNRSTIITYKIPESGRVNLRIYDLLGRLVSEIDPVQREAGKYKMQLDLPHLASGIYFYRLKVKVDGQTKYKDTHKLLLIK